MFLHKIKVILARSLFLLCAASSTTNASANILPLGDVFGGAATASAPSTNQIEVGFSPNQGAEELVLKVIGAARSEIRLLGYSFTSMPVTHALLDAKRRGVDVAIVVDYEINIVDDRYGSAAHALSLLTRAGVTVRVIDAYPMHHDKSIVVDRAHVETGSFNFSDAAARKNSENVIVLWNNPDLAKIYLKHWEERFALSQPYRPSR